MGRTRWALPLAAGLLLSGCAYEFSDRYCVEHVKFRRDAVDFLSSHDLEKGDALMIILRDQTPGLAPDAVNTVKLGIEIPHYDIGVPIDVETEGVVVRFSDVHGNPPRSGIVGHSAKGVINILKMNQEGLLIDVDFIIVVNDLRGGGEGGISIDDRFWCRWLPPDPDQLPPYLGGTKESPR
jgi:hypothetical protein